MLKFKSTTPQLPEILALHGKWQGDKDAVICGQHRITWRQFIDRINQVANGLNSLGLSRGDRIVVLMSNQLEMVETLFGIMAVGCVSVPLNVSVSDEAVESMCRDADASLLICTGDHQHRLIGKEIDGIQYLTTAQKEPQAWLQYHSLVDKQSCDELNVDIQPDDLLNIIYSSGTTGLPKGIAHSFQGRLDWTYDLALALRYHTAARTLLTIGLYSNINWVAMLATLLAGGTIIVHKTFDPDAFWQTVEQERITHTAMVPIQYQRITEVSNIEKIDSSSFDGLMCCGSPLHEGLKRRLFEIFDCGLIELYGLTEGVITTLDPEDAEGRWSSVGKPLIGTDILILDNEDNSLPAMQSGEILSRGRITMPMYYNKDEATNEAMWVDQQGREWIRTGDIGYADDQGFIYIVDRKKDMILSGGQNIYPQDIEAVLVQNDIINDVAVIAAASKRWGETPIALVVLEPGADANSENIQQWCNQRVGKQQRIADAVFIDELPRNPNGKILKRELRKIYGLKEYG